MLSLLSAFMVFLALAVAPDAPPPIALSEVTQGLTSPIGMTHAGDGSGRLFINEQAGRIRIWDGTQLLPTPFLDITSLVSCCGERGLIGLAFHPHFDSNGYFFVHYTNVDGDTVLARYAVSADLNVADPASAQIILTVDQPFANHNGGDLAFGPEGYLYIALGDGGSAGDASNPAQDPGQLLGKILRIDVDSASPYAIPSTNPFAGQPGARGEVWAYGLRNPWRSSFDIARGDLFIGDVGQASREEINHQAASSGGGQNYGWPRKEGTLCYNPSTDCDPGGLVDPILEYDRALGRSVTGGYRYRGSKYPLLNGFYLYGDFVTARIWGAAQAVDGSWTTSELRDESFLLPAFGEDETGELYAVSYSGTIYRIGSLPEYTRGDFNSDGDVDLVWRHYGAGANDVWLMDGTSYVSSVGTRRVAESQWRLEGAADFNKDGKTDLVWRNYSTGENVIWLMDGAAYQSSVVIRRVPEPEWRLEGTGDFNRDGYADLVWRHATTGWNVIWLMDGTTYSSSVEIRWVPEPEWRLEATGDFNRDGWTDLVWRHDSGLNVVWLMNGTNYVSSVPIRHVPESQWRIEASGDFNADGHTDLVWRHYGTGVNVVWLMHKTTYMETVALPRVPDLGWEIEAAR